VTSEQLRHAQERTLLPQLASFSPSLSLDDRQRLRTILASHNAPSRFADLNEHRIRAELRAFATVVITPLDKNSKAWALICPKLYEEKVHSHFGGTNNPFYAIVRETDSVLRKRISDDYKLLRLSDAAAMRHSWSLGHAYLLPKNKDVNKSRPLVSFFHFCSKPLGRLVSRALSVMIKSVAKIWNTYDAFSTTDAINSLRALSKRATWQQASAANSITMIKFDIKNQFTSLDKTAVTEALRLFINAFRRKHGEFVSVTKRRNERHQDCPGTRSRSTHHVLSLSTVSNYCVFEMRNAVFRVGTSFVQQLHGLPMGGFVSACLAVLWAMSREHISRSAWNPYASLSLCTRFRDDIYLIVRRRVYDDRVEDMRRALELAYGGGIELELEEISYTRTTFLDVIVSTTASGITVGHFNRNLNFLDSIPGFSVSLSIQRFPEFGCGFSKSVYLGTMIGALKRVVLVANTVSLRLLAFLQLIFEWRLKRYPKKWIRLALFCSGSRECTPELLDLVA
jgi:hypothetical protein